MHIEETQNGDLRSALGLIVNSNNSSWRRFIGAILKNKEDAEDVIQEAVHRVLVRNRALPSQEAIRMYLGRAIGNAARELYNSRKRERRKHIPLKEHLIMPSAMHRPDEFMEEKERCSEKEFMLGILHEGLKLLPAKQHEALRITALEGRGLSLRNVCARNGIPYSTLRHRSKQGLRMMRKYLERTLRERNWKLEDVPNRRQ